MVTPDGYVYARIEKAWYGLKEAGFLANQTIVGLLKKHGYYQAKHTKGLFRHKTRDISFTLIVDDLGIKYTDEADVKHLLASLEEVYTMTLDMDGKKYIGLDFDWDYDERTVTLSMDGYVIEALTELKHIASKQHFYGPSKMERPNYGAKVQYVKEDT